MGVRWGFGHKAVAVGGALLLSALLAACSQTTETAAPGAIARSEFADPGQPLMLVGDPNAAAAAKPGAAKAGAAATAEVSTAAPAAVAALPPDPAAPDNTLKQPKPAPKKIAKATADPAAAEPERAGKVPAGDATRDIAPPEPAVAPVEATPEIVNAPPLPKAAKPAASAATATAAPEPAAQPEPEPQQQAASTTPPPPPYPNINQVPEEPGGKLLSPEERKKLISKLNALAKRQGGKTTSESGSPCPEGTTEAECRAAIE
jgi:hypothetical protein